ncbi:hypothetical protein DFH11DRAFT_1882569 [Phellopilus nigrolimitatus]|nr:hypothetical protein DFH11DRAFT_1882569 [Phellopilus nigrolimitatus]
MDAHCGVGKRTSPKFDEHERARQLAHDHASTGHPPTSSKNRQRIFSFKPIPLSSPINKGLSTLQHPSLRLAIRKCNRVGIASGPRGSVPPAKTANPMSFGRVNGTISDKLLSTQAPPAAKSESRAMRSFGSTEATKRNHLNGKSSLTLVSSISSTASTSSAASTAPTRSATMPLRTKCIALPPMRSSTLSPASRPPHPKMRPDPLAQDLTGFHMLTLSRCKGPIAPAALRAAGNAQSKCWRRSALTFVPASDAERCSEQTACRE